MNFKVSGSLLCWACTEFGGYKLEATLFHAQSITASNWVMFLNPHSSDAKLLATEGPRIMQILGLEKNHETCIAEGPLLMQKSSTCAYISKTLCTGTPLIRRFLLGRISN